MLSLSSIKIIKIDHFPNNYLKLYLIGWQFNYYYYYYAHKRDPCVEISDFHLCLLLVFEGRCNWECIFLCRNTTWLARVASQIKLQVYCSIARVLGNPYCFSCMVLNTDSDNYSKPADFQVLNSTLPFLPLCWKHFYLFNFFDQDSE